MRSDLGASKQKLEAQEAEICDLEAQASKLREAIAGKFPSLEKVEAADLLNQLKGRRKKSKADLADVEAILELMGDCDGDG